MRSKAILRELDDVLVLYRHLYMNPENRIVVNNGMADLEIRLDENLQFYCKNLNFPDSPGTNYSEQMTLCFCLDAVDYLKEQKSQSFKSMWDEIKFMTSATMAINSHK
jgi:hypothetical protein